MPSVRLLERRVSAQCIEPNGVLKIVCRRQASRGYPGRGVRVAAMRFYIEPFPASKNNCKIRAPVGFRYVNSILDYHQCRNKLALRLIWQTYPELF